jgi:hypothetical protein
MLTQYELAHLRGLKSIRTLQKERRLGRSIAWVKDGRKVLYPREAVLERFGARAA